MKLHVFAPLHSNPMTCDYYYGLENTVLKKTTESFTQFGFLHKIFCVLHTTRSDKFKFLNRQRGDFHFMFCSPLKLRLNQIKCDATGENPMNGKIRKTRKRKEKKKSFLLRSFNFPSHPENELKSVHICKRQEDNNKKKIFEIL